MTRWLILLATCLHVSAQPNVCYIGSTNLATNINCPTNPNQNPDIKTYVGALNSAFTNAELTISGMPTPKLINSLEIPPASASFRENDSATCYTNNTCIYSTAGPSTVSIGLSHYLDAAVIGSGATAVDDNYDPLYYSAASEYSGSAVPGSVKWMQYQLSVDDSFFQHVKMTGTLLRLAAAPMQSTYQACNLNAQTMTAQQAQNCLNPLITATIAHLKNNGISVFGYLPWHEPTGITQNITGQTFSTTDWTNMVNSGCAAVHSVDPNILCGGGFASGEGLYITALINGATPDINLIGMESYGGVDPSQYMNILSTLAKQCAQVKAANLRCDNTEGDPPRHVPSTSAISGSEQYAYEGCTWETGTAGWQTFNLHSAWASITSRYLAAYGFSSFTRFSSQPFAGYTTDITQNCFQANSSTLLIMQGNGSSTTAAASYKTAILWGGSIPVQPVTLSTTSITVH